MDRQAKKKEKERQLEEKKKAAAAKKKKLEEEKQRAAAEKLRSGSDANSSDPAGKEGESKGGAASATAGDKDAPPPWGPKLGGHSKSRDGSSSGGGNAASEEKAMAPPASKEKVKEGPAGAEKARSADSEEVAKDEKEEKKSAEDKDEGGKDGAATEEGAKDKEEEKKSAEDEGEGGKDRAATDSAAVGTAGPAGGEANSVAATGKSEGAVAPSAPNEVAGPVEVKDNVGGLESSGGEPASEAGSSVSAEARSSTAQSAPEDPNAPEVGSLVGVSNKAASDSAAESLARAAEAADANAEAKQSPVDTAAVKSDANAEGVAPDNAGKPAGADSTEVSAGVGDNETPTTEKSIRASPTSTDGVVETIVDSGRTEDNVKVVEGKAVAERQDSECRAEGVDPNTEKDGVEDMADAAPADGDAASADGVVAEATGVASEDHVGVDRDEQSPDDEVIVAGSDSAAKATEVAGDTAAAIAASEDSAPSGASPAGGSTPSGEMNDKPSNQPGQPPDEPAVKVDDEATEGAAEDTVKVSRARSESHGSDTGSQKKPVSPTGNDDSEEVNCVRPPVLRRASRSIDYLLAGRAVVLHADEPYESGDEGEPEEDHDDRGGDPLPSEGDADDVAIYPGLGCSSSSDLDEGTPPPRGTLQRKGATSDLRVDELLGNLAASRTAGGSGESEERSGDANIETPTPRPPPKGWKRVRGRGRLVRVAGDASGGGGIEDSSSHHQPAAPDAVGSGEQLPPSRPISSPAKAAAEEAGVATAAKIMAVKAGDGLNGPPAQMSMDRGWDTGSDSGSPGLPPRRPSPQRPADEDVPAVAVAIEQPELPGSEDRDSKRYAGVMMSSEDGVGVAAREEGEEGALSREAASDVADGYVSSPSSLEASDGGGGRTGTMLNDASGARGPRRRRLFDRPKSGLESEDLFLAGSGTESGERGDNTSGNTAEGATVEEVAATRETVGARDSRGRDDGGLSSGPYDRRRHSRSNSNSSDVAPEDGAPERGVGSDRARTVPAIVGGTVSAPPAGGPAGAEDIETECAVPGSEDDGNVEEMVEGTVVASSRLESRTDKKQKQNDGSGGDTVTSQSLGGDDDDDDDVRL